MTTTEMDASVSELKEVKQWMPLLVEDTYCINRKFGIGLKVGGLAISFSTT